AEREEAERPFDLTSEPPLRCRLLRLAADEHVLLLTLHHIAADGWSIGLLKRELAALSRRERLEPLPVQYADYAIWQREVQDGDAARQALDHLCRRLRDVAPLELPADRSRPAVRSGRGAALRVAVDRELLDGLRELGRREGATLFTTL